MKMKLNYLFPKNKQTKKKTTKKRNIHRTRNTP